MLKRKSAGASFAAVLLLVMFAAGLLAQTASPTRTTPINPADEGVPQDSTIPVSKLKPVALPAARILSILDQVPSEIPEIRTEIVAAAHSQGKDIPENISDNQVFSLIRQDERARVIATNVLIHDEIVDPDDPDIIDLSQGPAPAESNDASSQRTAPGETRATDQYPNSSAQMQMQQQRGTNAQAAQRRQRPTTEEKPVDTLPTPELKRRPSPYVNIPSLRDLYVQDQDFDTTKLKRFGADLFNTPPLTTPSDVPVDPSYVIGPGDALVINLWGSISRELRETVSPSGQVALPEAGTVMVAGKSLADARTAIETSLRRQYQKINVDVSLGRLRSVRVYVVGEVNHPGAYDVSSAGSILNAIYAAGGASGRGSLRLIQHLRGKQLVANVDLYDMLLKGVRSDVERLQSGDTILVPPVGPQVAVAGMVRRPAIYELKGASDLNAALELAGGVQVQGALSDIKVQRVVAHEQKMMLSVQVPDKDLTKISSALAAFPVQDGDVVVVPAINPSTEDSVYLQGHVTHPGKFPFKQGMTVKDLVATYKDLLPEPAATGEVIRLEKPDYSPVVTQFNVADALSGKSNVALQPFDTVRFFGRYELDAPAVSIYGEVLRPGKYPMRDGMMATELLRMAGGFKRSAFRETADLASYSVVNGRDIESDHREIEITRALAGEADTDVRLKPGDVLTIRQIAGWNDIGAAVRIDGEVEHPGTYGIQQNERLSSVLERAGGFRNTAYPNGIILTREQAKIFEAKARDTLVKRIESATPAAPTSGEAAGVAVAFAQQQQQIVKRLREQEIVGRQIIHIGPDITKWKGTPADIELRDGDSFVVPKKPNFVEVSGQVNSPSAITYSPGKNAEWYLHRAGGPTEFGSMKNVFIVRADGSVIGRASNSLWRGGVLDQTLMPGDSVVVPEKIIAPNMLWKNLLDTAQVMSSVAIAARVAASF